MALQGNSFWVRYSSHKGPMFLADAEGGQSLQRNTALRFVTKWRTCVDIGSNVGQWTRPLSEKFQKVICFEPNREFIECFNKNISADNVTLHNFGLSDKEHTATTQGASTVLKDEPGDVLCRTLDSFDLHEVDFMKIDVDGFELQVVEGARQTLENNGPVINIEMKRFKRPDLCQRVDKLLKSCGYSREKTTKSDEVWLKTK